MMTTKKSILSFLLISITTIVISQDKDFGIWYGISTEHNVFKKLELDLSTCIRTFDNASKIEEAFLAGGLTYKFNKYLSVAGSYRITENIEDDNAYHLRHKWFVDLKGLLSFGDLSLSGRFRFQERYKTYFEDEGDKTPDSHGRIRLKAQYDIPSFPINPYVAEEIFCPMFTKTTRYIDKNRFTFGLEYNISKRHSIEAEYIFQRDYLPKLSDIHLIFINYNFKF